jgi:AcrR family transcriptional regulator
MLMYPDAQIPVAQLSVQPEAGLPHHLALGRALMSLRASGVLILCCGAVPPDDPAAMGSEAVDQTARFHAWVREQVSAGAAEALLACRQDRLESEQSLAGDEHLLPLLVAMGAGGGAGRPVYEGFAPGSVGMAAYLFEGGEGLEDSMAQRRSRLRRDDRERMILEEAIRFFCEHGLDGQTRALADRLNITQPLIYRYFPDKEALVARVFDELLARRWDPAWARLIADSSRPLAERLHQFVIEYGRALCQDGWMRLIVSAGMKNCDYDARFLGRVRDDVVMPLCAAARAEFGLPGAYDQPYLPAELEAAWGVHGRLFFVALREWLHRAEAADAIEQMAAGVVAGFMAAARVALPSPEVARAAE